jgi:cytochrome c oxidase subunit 2
MPRPLPLWSMLCMALVLAVPIRAAEQAPGAVPTVTGSATRLDASAIVDQCVAKFNPDVYRLDDRDQPVFPGRSMFGEPASDVAHRVLGATWFSTWVFLPFLILPQVLLLVVIFKFKDRGDGRKPATFLTNHKLEVIWTAIPFLAVLIVSIPTYYVLDYMDSPPVGTKNIEVVTVTGKQFAWDYEYKRHYKDPTAAEKVCVASGQDPVSALQEPLVLVKDRTVSINLTSQDVNHAWWIPAFGVKKDAIKGRFTYLWFTPDTLGVYKGQCAELCGQNHGNMIITASVVEEADFDRYMTLLRHRDDTAKVWGVLQPTVGTAFSAEALDKAIAAYLAKGDGPERQFALSYWMASNYASLLRARPAKGASIPGLLGITAPATERRALEAQFDEAIRAKRKQVDAHLPALGKLFAAVPAHPDLQ